MKKTALLILFFSIRYFGFSQPILNFDERELKKYAGVWQYVNEKDTFTFILKNDSLYKSQNRKDSSTEKLVMYCWHRYVENGVEVENNLENINNLKKCSGLGSPARDSINIYLELIFLNSIRNRNFRIFFKLLNKENSMALWESWPQERLLYPPPKPKIWEGQTIPSPIILNKISDN